MLYETRVNIGDGVVIAFDESINAGCFKWVGTRSRAGFKIADELVIKEDMSWW